METGPARGAAFTPTPRNIGPYNLVAQIGEGGMGVVYRAAHATTGLEVALKTVIVPDASHIAGMRREIDALRRLSHPGIVRIVDAGVDGGVPWYAMELLEGRTLRDVSHERWSHTGHSSSNDESTRIARKPGSSTTGPANGKSSSVPPKPSVAPEKALAAGGRLRGALTLFRKICAPLAFLHGEGIVHGDLKPTNVFIRHGDTPVLVDFGLVWRFAGAVGREVIEVAGLQAGTAGYMAPEQIAGELVDARADLYALGCMLYEAVTGRLPYVSDRVFEVIQQHLAATPIPPSHLVEGVPAALEELILRLLAKRPRDRIGHSDAVVSALEAAGAEAEPMVGPSARAYLYRPELAGREDVVAALRVHLTGARHGAGSFALLCGESGIGKTYVAMEIARIATSEGMRVVPCACSPLGAAPYEEGGNATPLHPFQALLEAIADRCLEEGLATTARLFGTRGRVLATIDPDIEHLPGQHGYPAPDVLPAAAEQHRLLTYLGETVAQFSMTKPLLVLVDDLQWADELSRRFLASLGEAYLRETGIFVLATCRTEEMGAELRALAALPFVHRIDLGRLDEPTVRRLMSDMLGMDDPGDEFLGALMRGAEGNPFYVAEYLRTALAESLLFRDESGHWQVDARPLEEDAQRPALPLPPTLRALVSRRIDGLSQAARDVVEVTSVFGREVGLETLGALSGLADDALLPATQELVARQVLEEGQAGGFRFIHDKVRETAYARVSDERRRELHRAAAEEIERAMSDPATLPQHEAELAHHFLRAGDGAKAAFYLDAAGVRALRTSSNREAVSFFRDALALASREPSLVARSRRAAWERQLGEAYFGLGRTKDAREHLTRAVDLVGRPLPATTPRLAAGLLANAVRQASHLMGPRRVVVREPEERAALLEATRAYDLLMQLAYQDGGPLPVLHATLSALNLAERVGPSPELALAYANAHGTAGIIPLRGLAETYARRARETLRDVPDRAVDTWLLLMTSVYQLGSGRWEEAQEGLERAASIAAELCFKRRWEEATGTLSALHFLRGDFVQAREACEAYYASTLRGDAQGQFWALLGLAQAHRVRGQIDEGIAVLERAEGLAGTQPGRAAVAWMHAELALCYLIADAPSAARRRVDEADALLQKEPPVTYFAIHALAHVADVHVSLRRLVEAKRACAALERFARIYPIARPRLMLHRGRLLALDGRGDQAVRMWEASLGEARSLRMPFDVEQAQLVLNERAYARLSPRAPAPPPI